MNEILEQSGSISVTEVNKPMADAIKATAATVATAATANRLWSWGDGDYTASFSSGTYQVDTIFDFLASGFGELYVTTNYITTSNNSTITIRCFLSGTPTILTSWTGTPGRRNPNECRNCATESPPPASL